MWEFEPKENQIVYLILPWWRILVIKLIKAAGLSDMLICTWSHTVILDVILESHRLYGWF